MRNNNIPQIDMVEMIKATVISWVILFSVCEAARLSPLQLARVGDVAEATTQGPVEVARAPAAVVRARVLEWAPPKFCAGHCASPPAGPVCAFDAAGTARTFATLCELEAYSCRESTFYAVASLGEC